jgi:hypothetical protein
VIGGMLIIQHWWELIQNWWEPFWDYVSDAKLTDLLLATFTALLVCYTYLLWRYSKITERAYVSGGGYFPGDPTTGWRGDTFQLTIDNYGKTPAFVTHVNIGYWSLSGGPHLSRRQAQHDMF